MNNQKFKADPYNFSNKLITKSDVIDDKKVNMNDFTLIISNYMKKLLSIVLIIF